MKKIPRFKNIQEEAAFWDSHSITDYWETMEPVTVQFIPAEKKIDSMTIRLEPELKKRLGIIAQKSRLSLSTIARLWLIDRLHTEMSREKIK